MPLVVLAGAEYGTGSSRDWAAKGTQLLGVRAVIAKSFERIHRSNLVGHGRPAARVRGGPGRGESLGLTGQEMFDIAGIAEGLAPGKKLTVTATGDGRARRRPSRSICRIDTPNEVDYYQHGGILHFVLRQLAARLTPTAKARSGKTPSSRPPFQLSRRAGANVQREGHHSVGRPVLGCDEERDLENSFEGSGADLVRSPPDRHDWSRLARAGEPEAVGSRATSGTSAARPSAAVQQPGL